MAAGTGGRDQGGSSGRGGGSSKGDFYTGGGGRSAQGLYHPHGVQPELAGCVLKAGEEIVIENQNPVRTELPGKVRGYVIETAYGWEFLGNGRTRECTAVPVGSTVLSEVNASGVSRGDLRVQMCATRINLKGGGIMPMECSPALGQDGASGVEAESDYQWGGIATGILLEATLSTVGALGGLIEGPAGVAVNVGTQGIRGVGSEYIARELDRPPVLTMKRGAIYRIQVNADISFGEE
jgi:type IV secretory pathway VirB10-like protein